MDPFTSTLIATLAGAGAGMITGWLNVKLKIMDLLASILMMIALYSINLRIMGRPNVPLISEPTIFTILQPEGIRSEEHTSELQSLMRISYAVFCLQKKNKHTTPTT